MISTNVVAVCLITALLAACSAPANSDSGSPSTLPLSASDRDFAARSSAPGVVRAFGFERLGDPVTSSTLNGHYPNIGWYPGSSTNPKLDCAIKASGNCSVRFDVPGRSGSSAGGMLYINFSPDLRTQFGAGDAFFVQWRQRFSPAMVSAVILGAEKDAKGALVDVGPTAIKQAILTTGDRPGRTFFSCTELEIVTTSYLMHRLPFIYQACGWADPLIDKNPVDYNDFRLENAMPEPYCTMYQVKAIDKAGDKSGVPPGCFAWHADEWMTFQLGITLGPRDDAKKRFVGSRVRLWGAHEARPSQLLVDMRFDILSGSPRDDQKYGKIFFGPYMTNKDPRQDHPLMQTWYDEFIVSRRPIADPEVGTLPSGADAQAATPALPHPTTAPPAVTRLTTEVAANAGTAAVQASAPDVGAPNRALRSRAPLSSLAAGEARDLGAFSDGSAGQRARTDYSSIVYDRDAKRMLLFGGGHGPGVDTDIRAFPLAARPSPWVSLYRSASAAERVDSNWDKSLGRWIDVNQPVVRHTFNGALMIGRKYYLMTSGGIEGHGVIAWYDPDEPDPKRRWSFSKAGQPPWYYASGAALDPVSGKVIVYGTDAGASNYLHLWLYDPRSDRITAAVDAPGTLTGFMFGLRYAPPLDRFIAFEAGGKITEIELDRAHPRASRISHIDTSGSPPPRDSSADAFAWNGHVFGGGIARGRFYAYDPVSRAWSARPIRNEDGRPATMSQVFYNIAYDPDSGCYIFIGTDWHTYAYRAP